MIPGLPFYINLLFILPVLFCLVMFFLAAPRSNIFRVLVIFWLVFQAAVTFNGFYHVIGTVPPHVALLAGPPLLFIIILFVTPKGRRFLDHFNLRTLTYLHAVRILVEIVLLLLVMQQQLPRAMSLEGSNFDIYSGVTAPLMAWLYFDRRAIGKNTLLIWNFICLVLVLNVVIYGMLSAQTVFQRFSFDHPNKAIEYFPFSWLPSFVVPVVILSHLIAIRRLLKK